MSQNDNDIVFDIHDFLDAVKEEWVNSPNHKETMLKAQQELERIKEEHK